VTIESSEAVEVVTHERDIHLELAEAWAQLAAKDEELSAKDEELSAKDEELSAKDEELAKVIAVQEEQLAAKTQR
jgi:hypothetical protein